MLSEGDRGMSKPYVLKPGEPLPEGMYEVSARQKAAIRDLYMLAVSLAGNDTQKTLILLEAALGFAVASAAKPDCVENVLDNVCRNVRLCTHSIIEQVKS